MDTVTKEIKPEDPLNICSLRFISHFELQRSYVEQIFGTRLHKIRNKLSEFVFFSHRCISKPLRAQSNYHFRTFFQFISCL